MITFRYVATQDTLRLETCKTQKFKAADNHAHKQTYTQLIHNLYMSPQKKKKTASTKSAGLEDVYYKDTRALTKYMKYTMSFDQKSISSNEVRLQQQVLHKS